MISFMRASYTIQPLTFIVIVNPTSTININEWFTNRKISIGLKNPIGSDDGVREHEIIPL